MKVLFIRRAYKGRIGGTVCSERNLQSLKDIYGVKSICEYKVYGKEGISWMACKVRLLFQSIMLDVTDQDVLNIDNIINKEHIESVFLDSSLFGVLAKYLKTKYLKVTIVSFFHNCEYKLMGEMSSGVKAYFNKRAAFINESLACQYSDKVVVLNDRDKSVISSLYFREADYVIPISLRDNYIYSGTKTHDGKLKALFIGSYFYPNIHGVKWFVSNVLPKVNIHLTIVGNNMDKLVLKEKQADISIYSGVKDLSVFYENADFVIMPIFKGSGMKVKTAEALMYGKLIISTPEAVEGYEVDSHFAKICTNSNEFIDHILQLSSKECGYNSAARQKYLECYSYSATLPLFCKLFD